MTQFSEFDVFEHDIIVRLGLLPPGDEGYLRCKPFFWSRNSLGEALGDFIRALIAHGAVVENEDGDLAWSESFDLAKAPNFLRKE